jgi:predicted lipoprotein with Yx(FWY)xxD motif
MKYITKCAVAASAAVLIVAGSAVAAEKRYSKTVPSFIPVEISVFEDRNEKGEVVYRFSTDSGHPFYTRDKDPKGKSTCTDECKEDWSPVRARAGAKPEGDFTLFDRGNNYMQWMYKGQPIYQNVAQAVGLEENVQIPPGWSELVP